MPPPRVILGTPAALEDGLAREVQEWKQRDPLVMPLVLVGGTLLRPYLRRRLAHLVGGHVNLRFLTLGNLARELGEAPLAASGRQPLPRVAARVLAGELAAGASGYFEPVAQAQGFAPALERLFRELAEAGVGPAELRRAADGPPGDGKHAALAALYEEFERRRSGYYTTADCLAAADPERFRAPALLVYGVWDLPALARRLLQRLMERAPVAVYLPVTGTDADRAHQDLRDWLAGLGAREEQAEPGAAAGAATSLGWLQQRLYSRDGAGPKDGTVRLLSAPDPVREVQEAARACLRWAREGIAFHEMAVAYRQEERYRALVNEVFKAAGIPVYLHDGLPAAAWPAGRSLLALLSLIGSPLRRRDVMEFLTETGLPEGITRRYGAVEPASWDALSREAGIVEGRAQWRDRLRLLAELKRREWGAGDEPPDERLQAVLDEIDRLARFVEELAGRLAAHPAVATWREHLDSLASLAAEYVDGAGPLLKVLETLEQAAPLVERVSRERFQRAVRTVLEETDGTRLLEPEPAGMFGRQGVNVLDVNSLRHLRFRAVAVLGLMERSFPPPPRGDALLPDGERQELNRAMGWSLPLRALGPDAEPLQFAVAVHAAEERLQLSYARNEAGAARPHLPSHFFRAAAEALVGEAVPAEGIDKLDAALYTRVPATRPGAPSRAEALTEAEYNLTLLAEDRPLAVAWLGEHHGAFRRSLAAWAARWRDRALTPYDGLLGNGARAILLRRAGLEGSVSPSRLETYATCPFRFFLGYLLRVRPVEEPELLERIDARERGSLVHRVLERFLRECGEADPPRPERRAAHLERLRAVALEECDERERRGLVGYRLLWEMDRQAILEDLVTWYDREVRDAEEHGLRPGAFELWFGPAWGDEGAEDRTLQIEAGGTRLRFQGRIDRVDWSADRTAFRVIDYKTGSVSPDHRDGRLSGGRALQLPIYLLGAAHVLGIPWERGEAQYFYVSRKGGFKRVRFDGAALRERWEEFTGLLHGLARSMAEGVFHPAPGPAKEHCKFCDYRNLCDARVDRLAERKRDDPRAAAFIRLTEVT